MIKLTSLINELIMTDLTKGRNSDTKYFMVYKGKLFIFDDDSKIGRAKKSLKDYPQYRYVKDEEDMYNFLNSAAEAGPDILVGEWYPNKQHIVVWNQQDISPYSSLQVKKVVKALKAKSIGYRYTAYGGNDTKDKTISAKKATGEIPQKMYHGTSSTELSSILKYGLDPGRGPGRFLTRDIEHTEYVFLSGTFAESVFYAYNASQQPKSSYGRFPIVLELDVPDKSLIVPDYDADVTKGEEPYYQYRVHAPRQHYTMKAMGVSREIGKWGYKGRIPAKFIKWVWYYNKYQDKWHRSRPEIWLKLLQRYDWDTISYKLGMNDL